jgi:hypothetical protein
MLRELGRVHLGLYVLLASGAVSPANEVNSPCCVCHSRRRRRLVVPTSLSSLEAFNTSIHRAQRIDMS